MSGIGQRPPHLSNRIHIDWISECGCTGIQIEATTLLAPFADPSSAPIELLAHQGQTPSVHLNACQDTCPSFAAQAARALAAGLAHSQNSHWRAPGVHVVHLAYLGICGVPPELVTRMRSSRRRRGHVFVARAMVETEQRLPSDAVARCNHFDAVWVPSDWNRQVFVRSGVQTHRVHVLTEAVDVQFWKPWVSGERDQDALCSNSGALTRFREARTAGLRSFIFISVFKWERRKNWQLLVRAFLSTFAGKPVQLWIKTSPYMQSAPRRELRLYATEELGATAKDLGQIIVIEDRLRSEELRCAYNWADAFVLPSRGEGFGLPLAEAMSMGLPVLGPRFGGSKAFTEAAGVPLNGSMRRGEFEVHQTSLRRAMEAAVEGRYAHHGALSQAYMERWHAPEVVAGDMFKLARETLGVANNSTYEGVTDQHEQVAGSLLAVRPTSSLVCACCVVFLLACMLWKGRGSTLKTEISQRKSKEAPCMDEQTSGGAAPSLVRRRVPLTRDGG